MQVNELGFKDAWARRTTKDFGEGYWEYGENFLLSLVVCPSTTVFVFSFFVSFDVSSDHVCYETDFFAPPFYRTWVYTSY